jgi:hypothetical protein
MIILIVYCVDDWNTLMGMSFLERVSVGNEKTENRLVNPDYTLNPAC